MNYTICPRSSDPIYILSYYIKWVTTSWTQSNISTMVNIKVVQILSFVHILFTIERREDEFLKILLKVY